MTRIAAVRFNRIASAGLAALLVVLQLPLLLNPGYLSFDELQWWARADVASIADLPWVSWTDVGAFQYRPLTFNLWLAAAHGLAAHAFAMHAVFVVLGTLNALLVSTALRAFGVRASVASVAAIVFVLSPYAAYTHGWTGTLADLLVLAFGLLGTLAVARDAANGAATLATVALIAIAAAALLAKESAIVLPLLWYIIAASRFGWRRATVVVAPSFAVVAVYLSLRLPTLWSVDAANAAYAWHVANIGPRLGEYLLFPWLPPLFEIGPTLDKSVLRLAAAATCLGVALLSVGSAGWRHAFVLLLLTIVALSPVLVLAQSCNQYAYLASAVAIGVGAYAWDRCPSRARRLLVAVIAIVSLHGILIILRMGEVGAIERRFHGDLIALLRRTTEPLHIVPARAGDAWMLQRWVDDVPSYRGVPVAGHATTKPASAGAIEVTMQADGTLTTAASL